MTEGNRKTQLTTGTRRAGGAMERRSITEAGSAPTGTSAGNKKPTPKTRATNRSGTRLGAERKTERDATKGTKRRRETERETTSRTEIRKETKTSRKTEAKSARRKESVIKTKRGISLGRGVAVRFVILIKVGINLKVSLFRRILLLNYTHIKPTEAVLQLGVRYGCSCIYTVCVCV